MSRENESGAEITLLGGGSGIGRTCVLVHFPRSGTFVLCDCGIGVSCSEDIGETNMGSVSLSEKERLPLFHLIPDIKNVACILVSHYHLDHVGALPHLTQKLCNTVPEYSGSVVDNVNNLTTKSSDARRSPLLIMTPLTFALSPLVIHLNYENAQCTPLDTHRCFDPDSSRIALVEPRTHDKVQEWKQHPASVKVNEHLTVEVFHAGHVSGSVMFLLKCDDMAILFTGDVGISRTLAGPPALDINQLDCGTDNELSFRSCDLTNDNLARENIQSNDYEDNELFLPMIDCVVTEGTLGTSATSSSVETERYIQSAVDAASVSIFPILCAGSRICELIKLLKENCGSLHVILTSQVTMVTWIYYYCLTLGGRNKSPKDIHEEAISSVNLLEDISDVRDFLVENGVVQIKEINNLAISGKPKTGGKSGTRKKVFRSEFGSLRDPFRLKFANESVRNTENLTGKKAVIFTSPATMDKGIALQLFHLFRDTPLACIILTGGNKPGTLAQNLIGIADLLKAPEKAVTRETLDGLQENKRQRRYFPKARTVFHRNVTYKLSCRVVFASLTAHADARSLINFLVGTGTNRVILQHGQRNKLEALKTALSFYGVRGDVPNDGDTIIIPGHSRVQLPPCNI